MTWKLDILRDGKYMYGGLLVDSVFFFLHSVYNLEMSVLELTI